MKHKQIETDKLLMSHTIKTGIGKSNQYSGMASNISPRLIELRKRAIRESLSEFVNADHRLEPIAMVRGIEFINDSRATNVNATWYALSSMSKPTIWIAGGQDNGNDYSSLSELVRKKVKAIIFLGKENKSIKKAFKGIVSQICETEEAVIAVKMAYLIGKPGDVVLLSPACPSFDLFDDYKERGALFTSAVMNL